VAPTPMNGTSEAQFTDSRSESLPRLSVVVTITQLSHELHRCLHALETQCGAHGIEVIVPYDAESDHIEPFRHAHPTVKFIPMDRVPPEARSSDPALAHLMYDRRRAFGLAVSRGDLIAITEDRAIPSPDWCATILEQHKYPYAAIGGAIENGSTRYLNRAVYFCDFLRYQNPVPEGPVTYVSDVNVSYKRVPLDQIREIWRDFYHEPFVHSALRERGEVLWLTSAMIVRHDRGRLSLPAVISERFAWARLFAARRGQTSGLCARALLALFAPLLPVLLLYRRFLTVVRTGKNVGRFILALPLLCVLLGVWAAGEFIGYATSRPSRQTEKPFPTPVG
jgi:hypothetical protein